MSILGASSVVDTAAGGSKSVVSKDKLQEDLNRFLTLLVTQLQNQDPLDPMDTNEFTSQLVGFAGVEQQINTNGNLEKLLAIQQTSQVGSMVSFLGTTVQAKGDTFYLQDDFAAFTYNLPTNSVDTDVFIQNAAGKTVLTVDGETSIGTHGFTWDGKGSGGIQQEPGVYRAIVVAKDSDGKVIQIEQTVFGQVTGSGIGKDGALQLFLHDVEVNLDDIVSVNETPKTVADDGED